MARSMHCILFVKHVVIFVKTLEIFRADWISGNPSRFKGFRVSCITTGSVPGGGLPSASAPPDPEDEAPDGHRRFCIFNLKFILAELVAFL